jgi:NAD(P)-dependent dehydrogenase (short-subunit alcohol dehydrogenase family)
MIRLDGKVAIVTGAGTGLGRAHALALAAAGATVVVNNRRRDDAPGSAELVAAEVEALGSRALVDTASVADWDGMGALVERTLSEAGRLDIVVNNAGILVWAPIADIGEAAFDALMDTNVKGAFALTHHACAHWRAAPDGRGRRIVNTTSGIGLYGFPRGGLYGVSKAATVTLTNVTAMEMRGFGVTANTIWPEARTRMGKGIFPDAPEDPEAFDPYEPANISPLVVYLASDAADWLTGQVIYVQGDRIRRVQGWHVTGEHHSAGGGRFTPEELAHALPFLFGVLPAIQPETTLEDAMVGIDPER